MPVLCSVYPYLPENTHSIILFSANLCRIFRFNVYFKALKGCKVRSVILLANLEPCAELHFVAEALQTTCERKNDGVFSSVYVSTCYYQMKVIGRLVGGWRIKLVYN